MEDPYSFVDSMRLTKFSQSTSGVNPLVFLAGEREGEPFWRISDPKEACPSLGEAS